MPRGGRKFKSAGQHRRHAEEAAVDLQARGIAVADEVGAGPVWRVFHDPRSDYTRDLIAAVPGSAARAAAWRCRRVDTWP